MLIRRLILCAGLLFVTGCSTENQSPEQNAASVAKRQYERGMQLFFDVGDLLQAHDALDQIAKVQPDFNGPYYQYALGFIYRSWHEYTRAVPHFEAEYEHWADDRTRAFPKRDDMRWLIADAELEYGILQLGFLNSAANAEQNYYTVLLQMQAHRQIADIDSLTLHSQRLDYLHFYRGMCRFLIGQYEGAVSDFEQVPKTSEMYGRMRAWLAATHFQTGNRGEAQNIWQALIKEDIDPSEVGAAQLYVGAGDVSNAVALCQRAHQDGAASHRARLLYVWAMVRSGNLAAAAEALGDIDFRTPEFREVWGEMKLRGGEKVEYATSYYDPLVFRVLADLYFDRAEAGYGQYIEATGKREFQAYIGLAKLMAGDFGKAQALFQSVAQLDNVKGRPIELAAQLGLSIVAYKQGRQEEAEQTWQQLSAMRGDSRALWRSTTGYVQSRLRKLGDWRNAAQLCRVDEVNVPGFRSRNLGYALFVGGLAEGNMDLLAESIGYLEKNHMQESQYSVRRNDPFLLQKLSDANYNRNLFDLPPRIYLNFRDVFPESEQIFQCLQVTRQIWEVIKWRKEGGKELIWREMQRLPHFWFDEVLKQVIDRQTYRENEA